MKRVLGCLFILLLLMSACGSLKTSLASEESSGNSSRSEENVVSESMESSVSSKPEAEEGDFREGTPAEYRKIGLHAIFYGNEPYSEPYDPEVYEKYSDESREGLIPENTTDFSAWTPDWDGAERYIVADLQEIMDRVGPYPELETERIVTALKLTPMSNEPPTAYRTTTTWKFFQVSFASQNALFIWCEEDVAQTYAFLFGEKSVFDPTVLNRIDVGYGYSALPRPGFLYENGMAVSSGDWECIVANWKKADDQVCVKADFIYIPPHCVVEVEPDYETRLSVEYTFQIAEDGHLVLTGY